MRFNIFLFILFCSFTIGGQIIRSGNDLAINARYKFGFLGIHHSSMSHLPKDYAQAVEITAMKNSTGIEEIDRAFGNPNTGITFFHGSVGNNEILGNYTGIYGFAEFPIVRFKNFEWNSKLGTGIAYTNKCFKNQSQNIPIGSYFNAQICIGSQFLLERKTTSFHIGLDITHFSNAATELPNYGINIFYLSGGFSKYLTNNTLKKDTIKSKLKTDKWLCGGMLIGSWKETMPINGKKHSVFAANIHARRFFNYKSGIELSLDLIHKNSIYSYMPAIEKNFIDVVQIGFYGAYLIPLEKFHFIFGMGVYARDKFKPEDTLYHRIGMRYQWENGIIANLTLKTHFGRADYLEWGIGYTFNYE